MRQRHRGMRSEFSDLEVEGIVRTCLRNIPFGGDVRTTYFGLPADC